MSAHKLDEYRVEIGDTERSAEEIIGELKGHRELIAQVALAAKAHGGTAAGTILTITVTPAVTDAESLKHKLNEAGACMYQIEAVAKLP